MEAAEEETGRYPQRPRTRAAVVAAAADLISSRRTPSVNEVAEAADASRRTGYLYFPTIEQLLLGAIRGMLGRAAVDEAIEAADIGREGDGETSAEERVTAMVRALFASAAKTLPLGRSLIRLTVAPPEAGEDDDRDKRAPPRGYRRI